MDARPSLAVAIDPLPAADELAPRWRALEAAGNDSPFLAWSWIGPWLRFIADAPGTRHLLSVTRDGREIGLAVLGEAVLRRRMIRVPTLTLNATGDAGSDIVFTEMNGILCAAADRAAVAAAVADALAARPGWRELRLPGASPDDPLADCRPAPRRLVELDYASPWVDLARVRASGDLLTLLSSNTRAQMRRSYRKLEGAGMLATRRADGLAEARAWIEDMAGLGRTRRPDGAFARPRFLAFLDRLAAEGIESGAVEVLRFELGPDSMGFLLNLVHGGRAYNYQSAFVPFDDPHVKPGLMCHDAAIRHYAERGFDRYHFLAGKDRYKASLSTDADRLVWLVWQRPGPALEAEHRARMAKRAIGGIIRTARSRMAGLRPPASSAAGARRR